MKNVEFDKNMIVSAVDTSRYDYYNADSKPISIYGVFREGDHYVRMPQGVADKVSEGVAVRSNMTSGGRVRFRTDSKRVSLRVELREIVHNTWLSLCETVGFDVYENGKFVGNIHPAPGFNGGIFDSDLELLSDDSCIEIYMPTHSRIYSLEIGVEKGSEISHAPDYKHEKPIVFYGSSITHGSCASRPGMTYPAQLSRMLDTDFVNLGFGGLCKGEGEMAHYIGSLDMSVFVYDYDHNALTVEHLRDTHEQFFKIFRAKQPTTPVIMISRPTAYRYEDSVAVRFELIKRTYENARLAGDNNVYLINGMDFFGGDLEYTLDGLHPTDRGFVKMAEYIKDVLVGIGLN